jgi:hypothetical protein
MNETGYNRTAALVRIAALNTAGRLMEVGPPKPDGKFLGLAEELLAFYTVMACRFIYMAYEINDPDEVQKLSQSILQPLLNNLNDTLDSDMESYKVESGMEMMISLLTVEKSFINAFWALWHADLKSLRITLNYLGELAKIGMSMPSEDKTDTACFAIIVRCARQNVSDVPPIETIKTCEKIVLEDGENFNTVINLILKMQVENAQSGSSKQPAQKENSEDAVIRYGVMSIGEAFTKNKPNKDGRYTIDKITTSFKDAGQLTFIRKDVICHSLPIHANTNCDVGSIDCMSFRLHPNQGVGKAQEIDLEGLLPRRGWEYVWTFPDGSSTSIYEWKLSVPYNQVRTDEKLVWNRPRSTLGEIQNDFQTMLEQKDWVGCILMGQKAVDLFPRNSWGWINRSSALHQVSKTESAIYGLYAATKSFPGETIIFYSLSCYYAQLGKTQESKDFLKTALTLAAKEGGESYKKYRSAALEESDLAPIREAIPKIGLSSRVARFFG